MSMLDEQLFHVQRVRGAKNGIVANICLFLWKLSAVDWQGAGADSAGNLFAAAIHVILVFICCTSVWKDEPVCSRTLWYCSWPLLTVTLGTDFSAPEVSPHVHTTRLLIVAIFSIVGQVAFSGQLSASFSLAMWVPPLAVTLLLRAMVAVGETDLDEIERTWLHRYSGVEVGLVTLCAGNLALIWLHQPSLLGVLRRQEQSGGSVALPQASVIGRQHHERQTLQATRGARDEDEEEDEEAWVRNGYNSDETDEFEGAYAASTQSLPSTDCPDGSEMEMSDCCSD